MRAFIILPTQLFKQYKSLDEYDTIYLYEDPYYINKKFHKQKLVVYIAALRYYYDYLSKKLKHAKIKYVTFDKNITFPKDCTMYDPIDKPLMNKYKFCEFIDSPLFLETVEDLENYKATLKSDTNYSHAAFYKWNRQRLDILMDGDKPLYGKWSFDTENRKKFPNDYEELPIKTYNNEYIVEAKEYIEKHFNNNFGDISSIYYPTTHAQAETHFKAFIKNKLESFGPTQDAISKDVVYGEHSNISILLNTGLLGVEYVINSVLDYFYKSKNKKQIIASIEAFTRQLFWREYMRFIYHFHRDDLVNNNYFGFTKKIGKDWYDGTTDIPILNHMIEKVRKYSYLHHIERLMIISNIAVLSEYHPKSVYNWFLRLFIDATGEWIMISNNQMGQSMSESIKITKRVYICSDNYIKKMSDFKKEDIEQVGVLYKKFLKKHKNKSKLKNDYMLSSQLKKY